MKKGMFAELVESVTQAGKIRRREAKASRKLAEARGERGSDVGRPPIVSDK